MDHTLRDKTAVSSQSVFSNNKKAQKTSRLPSCLTPHFDLAGEGPGGTRLQVHRGSTRLLLVFASLSQGPSSIPQVWLRCYPPLRHPALDFYTEAFSKALFGSPFLTRAILAFDCTMYYFLNFCL